MVYSIGGKLKYLRTKYALTQSDVAEGICSQAMISKIEKQEELYPSANLLYEISKKLGVPIDYFFSDEFNIENHIQLTLEDIYYHSEMKNFNSAYEIIKKEKKNPYFTKNTNAMRYLLWQEAICISELTGNHRASIKIIDDLMFNKKFYSLEELNILSSKITFLLRCNENEEAYDLQDEVIRKFNRLTYYNNYYNKYIFINILFLCTKATYYFGDFRKANIYCNKAIIICEKELTYYKLNELKQLKENIEGKLVKN
ncbi:helix-turn-helix domain-containing protein [Cytobacillus gottheilii]|uniref:helix-turn-helix domain-containing protein n=1 Tax=Cytobacillus gottheilii TaxID=859144 RepID=UPI001593047D|nr:helix-turn-helix transcriptional regulator [Cytobacillus gottheilii]